MNGSFLMLLLAAMLAWQVDAPPKAEEEPDDVAIAAAVQRLGDAEFTVRRAASQFLWSQGMRAEEALRQATRSPDVEVRLRASEILRDFEYGILPGVPREVVEQIVAFRSGNFDARQRAVQSLLAGDHLDTAIHLIGFDQGAASRQRLLAVLMQNPAAVEQYATLEKIKELVARVAPDQDEAWRRITVGQLLFSEPMIERLAKQGQLDALAKYLERETDPQIRGQLLSSVFANSTSLAAVLEHGEMPLLFALVDAVPDNARRTQLLLQLLSSERAIAQILEGGQLDALLARIENSLDGTGRRILINHLLQSPALTQLFEQRSVDELIAWLRQEKDPQLRGQLLAALMSSPRMQQKLAADGRLKLITDVAADEAEADARRAYLEAVVQNARGAMLNDATVKQALWQLIKSDEDVTWRAGVAAKLLRSGQLAEIFAEEDEAKWLLETIRRGDTGGKLLCQALFDQRAMLNALVENGHFDALWELARGGEEHQRGQWLAQLLRQPAAVELLGVATRISAVVAHASEEKSPVARHAYLEGLVTNRAAVDALVAAGRYEVLAELVLATDDATQRAMLFGRFAQNFAVIQYLQKQGQLSTLVEFAEAQDTAEARRAFLPSLFNSSALSLLLKAGYYDQLLAYVDQHSAQDSTLVVSFYTNHTVIERLIEADEIAELSVRIKSLDQRGRASFLRRLASNREALLSLVAAGHVDNLLSLFRMEDDSNQRGFYLSSLLGSTEVTTSLAAQDELKTVLAAIAAERDPGVRDPILTSLISNHDTLRIWIEAGFLDPLVDLVDDDEDPRRRSQLWGRLAGNAAALGQWEKEQRLASLLTVADSFGRGPTSVEARRSFESMLFNNRSAMQKLLEAGLYDPLLRIATRESDANHRTRLLQLLVQNPATTNYLLSRNRLPELLVTARDEPDERVRQDYLERLIGNPTAVTGLIDGGLYDEIAEAILAGKDARQRAALYGRLVQQPRAAQHLDAEGHIEVLLEFAEEQPTAEIRNAFLQPIFDSQLLTMLIERGHYGRLHRFLDDDVPSRDGLVASFYANRRVVDRLIDEKQIDLLLARANAIDTEARYQLLQRLMSRKDVLTEFVRGGQYDELAALVTSEPNPARRGSLGGMLWRSAPVVQQLAAQEQLGGVLEILRNEQDAQARRLMLQHVVGGGAIDVWIGADLLDPLIELIQQDQDAYQKAELLTRLVTGGNVLQHWAAKQQLPKVLALADSFGAVPASAEARRRYLMRAIGDHKIVAQMLHAGMYEKLVEVVASETDANARAMLLRSLMTNHATVRYLISRERLPELISLARSAPDEQYRRAYVSSLLNPAALDWLVDAGHYKHVEDLVLETEDALQRATLFGQLVQRHRVIEHLDEQKRLGTLWQFADELSSSEARDAFLHGLVNSSGMGLLIERGHYDRLRRFLEDETPARDSLVAKFYANTAVLERMVAEKQALLVLGHAKSLDEDARYTFLQQLVYRHDATSRMVKDGHFDALLSLIVAEPNPWRRGSLARTLLGSSQVAEQLAARKELHRLVEMITAETDAGARKAMLDDLIRNGGVLQYWIDHKLLDRLIALIQSEGEPERQAAMLAQVVTQPPVLKWRAEQQQLGSTFALADSLSEKYGQSVRRDYLQHVLVNANAVTALVNGGFLDHLLEFARSEHDSTQRPGSTLQKLLENPATVAWLVEKGTPERLIAIVRDAPEGATRSACLASLVRNPAAVAALGDAGQLETLVSFCQQVPDEEARRSLQARLLLSPQVVKYLAEQEMLADHLHSLLNEPDVSERHAMIGQLVTQAGVLRELDRAGLAEVLIDALKEELTVAGTQLADRGVSGSSELLQMLVERERVPLVVALINASPNPVTRRQHAGVLLGSPKVLRAVLDHVTLDRLLEHVGTASGPYRGDSPWFAAANSPEVVRILHEHQQLDRLFDAAEEEPRTRYQLVSTMLRPEMQDVLEYPGVATRVLAFARPSVLQPTNPMEAYRLLSHSGLRQTMIARGEGDQLLDLLRLVRPSEQDRLRNEILFSPSGLVVHHITVGEFAAAERLVDEHSADGDEGRLALAALLVSSSRLQPRIAELRQRIAETAEPEQDDLRALVYLYRAAGDLDAAAAAAEPTGDAALVHAIAHERRDWLAAARQLQAAPAGLEPPIPLRRSPPDEPLRRAERLGRLAAYWRLAGDTAKADAVLDQIEQLARESEQAVHWSCAEALLLNDRLQSGMELLEKTHPVRAVDLLAVRHEYAKALKLVGSDENASFDAAWYEALPYSGAGDNEAQQRQQRLELAVRVARLLRHVGRDESADKVVAFLASHVQQQPEHHNPQEWRRMHGEWLARELYRDGMYTRVWHVAEQAIKPGQEAAMLRFLFAPRSGEAEAWWSYLRRTRGEEPIHKTLRQIHYLLHPAHAGAEESLEELGDFQQLVLAASDATVLEPHQVSGYLTGLANTCIKRGHDDLALQVLEPVREQSFALQTRARQLGRQGRHREAAEIWLQAWEADRGQMVCLYLSGHALVQAGEVEEGEGRKTRASMSAMQSRVRHQMAWALYREGLAADAAEQWELVSRTAPMDHWEWNDAVRMLGDLAQERNEPEAAADFWEQSMLTNLRSHSSFNQFEYYLRLPCIIRTQRAVAAAAEGDCNAAAAEAERALDIVPGQASVAEELVPQLQKQQCGEAADVLFARVREHYQARMAEFPDSPELHNDLAWLYARCHRNLGDALAHARRAVERRPDNPGYVDTLAEVHFHLGDRDEAVRLSERSVALAPDRAIHQKQLERFRSAPLPE